MGYYLLDHPPASPQFYASRKNGLSGGVIVHTSEGPQGFDAAENTAAFISRRPDPGSYSCIVDLDSTIYLVPDDYTTFSVAASGYNSRTWSICLACRTDELRKDSAETWAMIGRAGRAIAEFWTRNGFNIASAARWLGTGTLDYPGLACHGDVQPWDRTDAWSTHPDRTTFDAGLISAIIQNSPKGKTKMHDLVRKLDGCIVQFGLAFGQLSHRWQSQPNGGFGPWVPLNDGQPFPFEGISAAQNKDGRFDVVCWNASTNQVVYRTQNLNGSWRPWRFE